MAFVQLTELYMEKRQRNRVEGESEYVDRDVFVPTTKPILVNMAHITCMRLEDVSYAERNPERYPQGRPQTTVLNGKGEYFTVIESPEQVLTLLQKAPSE